jgi:hypothetical protein
MPPLTIFAVLEKLFVNPGQYASVLSWYVLQITLRQLYQSVFVSAKPVIGSFADGAMQSCGSPSSLVDSARMVGLVCPCHFALVCCERSRGLARGLRVPRAGPMLRRRRAEGCCQQM